MAEASDAVGVTEGALVTMTSGESDEEYGGGWGVEDLMLGKRRDGAEWEGAHHEEVIISRSCKRVFFSAPRSVLRSLLLIVG